MDNLNEMGLEELNHNQLKINGGYWRGQNDTNANNDSGEAPAEVVWDGIKWGISAISAWCTFDPRC